MEGTGAIALGDEIRDSSKDAIRDLHQMGIECILLTGDIVLVKSNPQDETALIKLSKATSRKMEENLWWASGYNSRAIPLTAGALYTLGIILTPAVGAIFMSLCTVIVAVNAGYLKLEK